MNDGLDIAILCGGRGRRMGALTDDVPKPLVAFRGETILDLKIQDYIRRGCLRHRIVHRLQRRFDPQRRGALRGAGRNLLLRCR